ncbi:MAG: type ISP restriction/modification enzyme [bacterium]|nr:type ISP restriction/modification enzyme [bacterium]
MDAILWDFGNLTQQEDPVIHFYELFLAQYDKKKKIRRGVFYTPRPVVSYIVRSVDELLRTEFGLADGLADTATWGEMKRRFDCSPGFQPAVAQEQAGMPAPQELVESSDPPLTAGTCILRRPDIARIVQDALLHFEGQRYHLCAWCIMPNHVHVVVQALAGHELQDILHSWKSFTATKINRLLHRQGALWERESFNHLIRRAEHVERFVYYTEHNPVAAGLTAAPKDWPFSSCGAGLSTCGGGLSTCGAGFQPAPLEFVDPRKTPFVEPRSRGELPHLQKEGGTYFITWCLLDATCDAGFSSCGAGFQPAGSKLSQPRDPGFQPAGPEPSEPCDVAFQPAGSELSQPCGAGFQPAAAPEVPSAAAGEKGIGAGKMPAPQFHIPDGVKPTDPFVTILDPACGTGTFLVEVIDVIHRTMTEKWKAQGHGDNNIQALWNDYVPKHLLPRLHGYELMMAPYAIAHTKLPLKLKETGFTAWDKLGDDTRVRIYLTNSLEPPSEVADSKLADLFGPLAKEAQEVNDIKRNKRFTVVIGNPPYSNFGRMNRIPFILNLLEDYKRGLGEKKLNLDDDFVKFLRLSHSVLDATGGGVLGFITNNTYLDGITHRQMRFSLRTSMSKILVVDLHGSTAKKEVCPDGSRDKNVFDIQQGVAISLWLKRAGSSGHADVYHADLWGAKESKYNHLTANSVGATRMRKLNPQDPYHFFVPKDFAQSNEYSGYLSLLDIFSMNGPGVKTERDAVAIHWTRREAEAAVGAFRNLDDAQLRARFGLGQDSRDWTVANAKRDVNGNMSPRLFRRILYRPFDYRHTWYSGKTRGFIGTPGYPVMRTMLPEGSLGLLAMRQYEYDVPEPCYFLVTPTLTECRVFISNRGIANCFPLYSQGEEERTPLLHSVGSRQLNLRAEFIARFTSALGGGARPAKAGLPTGVSGETVFSYIYAVFHSPGYRRRYAEFLKIDFPRLPLTSSLDLFRALAKLGGELVALHLMESPKLDKPITEWRGAAPSGEVEKVSYVEAASSRLNTRQDAASTAASTAASATGAVFIDKAQTQGFHGVPENVWNFHIGGYQVCHKWLKDRKGRTLSADDITHYQKIVVALNETIRLMAEIDEVIEAHGGWPDAFTPGAHVAARP